VSEPCDLDNSENGDAYSRVRNPAGKGLWPLFILSGVILAGAIGLSFFVGAREDEVPYGFRGEVFSVGAIGHEILYSPGVEAKELVAIGEHLQQVGYFGTEFGGIIQLKANKQALEVFLSYSKRYWDKAEFAEEVAGIGHDLENYVVSRPVTVFAVDEDAAGLHQQQFFP